MADNAPDFGAGATKPMTSADTVSSRDAAETQPDAAFGTGDPVGPSKADIPGQGRDTAEGLDAPVDVSAAPHEVAPVPSEQHAPAEAPAEELSPADIPLDPVQAPAPEPDAAADDMAAAG